MHEPSRSEIARLGRELLDVLESESNALVGRDAAALEARAAEKARLVDALKSAGTGATAPDDALRDLLARCRERNRRNGGLLELRRRHAERVLRILHQLPDPGDIYDVRGQALPFGGKRSRARA